MSTAREIVQDTFDDLPDPDDVGQPEYRMVHDHVADLLEDGEDLDVLMASLKEIRDNAILIQSRLQDELDKLASELTHL